MIVDSNGPAPISYIDPTFSAQLFIRATIWDITTGTPTVAAQVVLAQVPSQNLYQARYTFLANHQYVVQKLGYTDNTYGTVDQTVGPSSDDVQCLNTQTSAALTLSVQSELDIEAQAFEMDIEIDC